MKVPLIRLPLTLLLLTSLFALFSYRQTISRTRCTGTLYTTNTTQLTARKGIDQTLLRLSEFNPGESIIKQDVSTLLHGDLPEASGRSGRYYTLHRHHHHPSDRGLAVFPKNLLSLPEFRSSLSNWYKNRYFQPDVMLQIANLTTRRRYKSCAVVGNSGILLKSENGELIDSHEFVIRLNNARVGRYERHVGSRTDISFINSNILHLCARRKGCFCHPYGENVPVIMYVCQAVHFLDLTVCHQSFKSETFITDARFDILCATLVKYYSLKRFVRETGKNPEEWKEFHDENTFHYSSGMQAIMFAVGVCDRVSVFGFGKSPDARHHYHTNQKAELDLHDYEAEYELYRDLANRPREIPFLTDSGFKIPPVSFYH